MQYSIILLLAVLSCMVAHGVAIQCYSCTDSEVINSPIWTRSRCKLKRTASDITQDCSGVCYTFASVEIGEYGTVFSYDRGCDGSARPTGCKSSSDSSSVSLSCACNTDGCNESALNI